MNFKPYISLIISCLLVSTLSGCTYVKRLVGCEEPSGGENYCVTQSANKGALVINQTSYDMSDKSDLESSLSELSRIENEIKQNLSRMDEPSEVPVSESQKSSNTSIFKQDEKADSPPAKKDKQGIFIQE